MALSDADWSRLDRMRREDRDHLDAVTQKLDADSVRQWKAISAIDKSLEVHKTESNGVHQQPCKTAEVLVGEHVEKRHNMAKTLGALAAVATIIGALGGLAFKIFHG